jgi:hypothetical protein
LNLGNSIEEIVESLCTRTFLADFTIRNPKFCKAGGQQKEAADLLIIFDGTLLAIQVKSKELNSPSERPAELEMQRISKTIEKAIYQFRALSEAMNRPDFKFLNGRGVEIAFDKTKIKEVVLIVVIAPIWRNDSAKSGKIRFDRTCYSEGEIPIHLFSLEQFSLLLMLLDTISDFFFYLDLRFLLHRENLLPMHADPIDEWALANFEKKKLLEMLEKHSFIDPTGLRERHRNSIQRLERHEKPSYFIDGLIEQLYHSIGKGALLDSKYKMLVEANSQSAYHLVIPHLAKMNRKQRSQVAEFLLNRVQHCRKQGIGFRGFKFSENSDEGYLVLALKGNRESRRAALYNTAVAAAIRLQANTMLGLAVGHDWPKSSCDVMFIDCSKKLEQASAVKISNQAFGKMRIKEG